MRTDPSGWCYVLVHPAWSKIGIVKIGMTARDPAKRAAEITAKSGLIAPAKVAWCCRVQDRRAVETAVFAALRHKRVRGRRELFRTDVATAVAAIQSSGNVVEPVIISARYRRRQPRRFSSAGNRSNPMQDIIRSAIVIVFVLCLFYIYVR